MPFLKKPDDDRLYYRSLNNQLRLVFINDEINPVVKDFLEQDHQINTLLSLRVLNRKVRGTRNAKYYFDENHILRFGREQAIGYAHKYSVSANVLYTYYTRPTSINNFNRRAYSTDEVYPIQFSVVIKTDTNALPSKEELDDFIDEKIYDTYRSSTSEPKEVSDVVENYDGRIEISRWGTPIRVNGSKYLLPNVPFIEKIQDWDKGNCSCFYDWVGSIFCNKRQFSKSMVKLKKLFKSKDWRIKIWEFMNLEKYNKENTEDLDENALWGVDLEDINRFCKYVNITMYLCDADKNVLYSNVREKANKGNDLKGYDLYGMIFNGHISPIIDKSVQKSLRERSKKTKKSKKKKKVEEIVDEIKEQNKIVWVNPMEEGKNMVDYLKMVVSNNGELPIYNIKPKGMDGMFNLSGFSFDDTSYIEDNMVNRLSQDFYGDNYKGQNVVGSMIKIFGEFNLKPSTLSPQLFDIFTSMGMKDRTMRGWSHIDHRDVFINRTTDKCDMGQLQGFDINKAYKYCCENPLSKWYVCDFNSVVEKYDGKALREGFYFLEGVGYNTPFTGSKFYSKAFVKVVLLDGLIKKSHIKSYIRPQGFHNKNVFRLLFKEVKKFTKEKNKVYKTLCNMITGILGRNVVKNYSKFKLTQQKQDLINYMAKNNGCSIQTINIMDASFNKFNGEKELHLYGKETKQNLYNSYLPMWVQLLDHSNLLMYSWLKKMCKNFDPVGTPHYRKTDCFVVPIDCLKWNAKLQVKISKNYDGGIKEEMPKKFYDRKDYKPDLTIKKEWETYITPLYNINDSKQVNEIIQLIKDGSSLFITGRGGTGKSHIINEIKKKLKVKCGAFTNKASLHIGGNTLHYHFGIDKFGRMSASNLRKLKEMNLDAFICDEISMNDKNLWSHLATLQRELNIPIVCLGDFAQLRPVEAFGYKYKYNKHPVVLGLFDYHINLTKNYRANGKFAENLNKFCEDMGNFPIETLGKYDDEEYTIKNLSYTNKTRKKVNEMIAKYEGQDKKCYLSLPIIKKKKKDDKNEDDWEDEGVDIIVENKIVKDDKKNFTQKIKVFEGMPMISRITLKDPENDDNRLIFNNEDFVINSIDVIENELMVNLTSLNRDNVSFNVKFEELQKYFLVAYCITIHKSQGQTYKEPYTIWDWYKFRPSEVNELKYVAVSRATDPKNVYIGKII